MKTAVISVIHGTTAALSAVLLNIEGAGVDATALPEELAGGDNPLHDEPERTYSSC